MDFNSHRGNNPRFAGQPQNQPYPGGMAYYPQGFPNQRPPMQQNMQYGAAQYQMQPQDFPGGFGQGQFPRNPNPQMQQAFNQKQYQKMMEQQQRMAQESQKLQNETRKKREFEMQQKRLQEFSRHGGGKKAGGGGSGDLSRLIGNLAEKGGGTKPAPKQHVTSSTGKSLFSRPGGFYQAPQKHEQHDQQQHDQQQHLQQSYQPQLWPNMPQNPGQPEGVQQVSGQQHAQQFSGQAHMQPTPAQSGFPQHHRQQQLQQFPGQPTVQPGQSSFSQHPGQPHIQQFPGQPNAQQQPGQSCFSQHPVHHLQQTGMQLQQSGLGDQSAKPDTNTDDDFSDFQEAPSSFSGQGSTFPSQQGTFSGEVSAFPGQGGGPIASSSVVSKSGGSTWSNQSAIHNQKNFSWQMNPNSISTMGAGFSHAQMVSGTSMTSGVTTTVAATSAVTGPRSRTDSQSSVSSSSSGGFLSSQPIQFGQSQNQPSFQGTSFMMQQGSVQAVMPGIPGQEQMKHIEQHGDVTGHVVPGSDGGAGQDEPEDPMKKLYGIDLPDWCTTGKDLPGVYKDVRDTVTLNGAIDTGKLYTVLLASELQRDILGQLWSQVNKATPGQLNEMELRMILGLIALGQTGLKVERLTLEKLATCKSAPIPSFPESVFKPEEGSWSFQKEPEKEEKESSNSLPVSGSFVGWQGQPSNNYGSTTDPNDKYCVFRTDNTITTLASISSNETTGGFSSGSWSLTEKSQSSLNQDSSKGTQMLGQSDPSNKLSTSPEFQEFQSVVSSSEADNDFGDFQESVSSLNTNGGMSQQSSLSGTLKEFGLDGTSKLTASLGDFKVKSETQQGNDKSSEFESFSSAETVPTLTSVASGRSGSSHGEGGHSSKPNAFALFPNITIPPQADSKGSSSNTPNVTPSTKPENKVESRWANATEGLSGGKIRGQDDTVDKYSFLRDLGPSITEDASLQSSRKKDDSFGDFESFEKANHSEGDDFGDFHSINAESVLGNQNSGPKQSQGWGFEGLSSMQLPKDGTNFANFGNTQLPGDDKSSATHPQDDFGDFADFQSSTSSSSGPKYVNEMPSFFPMNANFNQDTNGQVKNNFAVDQSRQRSSSTASNSFTSAIPLDSSQRYKLLSDEGEDMDKHDNVWSRCLNSCLLTLVTGALAVQKMSDPALKQEVLQSKKGIEYFTALAKVFLVTQRIQVSLMKTEFANDKLKDVLMEINQSWKNISQFLYGSSIDTNINSEGFLDHHIQADEDKSMACGVCLLNVHKSKSSGADTKISYGGRDYHATCANFWCNRVDSILPKLLPVNSLI